MNKLISAESLLLSVRDDPEINSKHFARIKEHIDHAPDAVKHGRWEERIVDHEIPYYTVVDCSLCGCSGERWHTYCPNCGAKMD